MIALPEILLDRASDEPLHTQISRQVAQMICEGKLGRGARLPSTRTLARMLGISRNTVLIAYETLAAEDLIRSELGSGARVNNWAPAMLPSMAKLLHEARYPECITLVRDPDGNPLYLRHDMR
ncbi:MAG: GntR family transcriptional regulator [Bryobacteraceae bacterium]